MSLPTCSVNRLLILSVLLLSACNSSTETTHSATSSPLVSTTQQTKIPPYWPKLKLEVSKDPQQEQKIDALLAKMTIEQKVAQTIQPEIKDFTLADMRKYGFGSYLNGGGSFPQGNKHATPDDWVTLAEQLYQASIDDSEDGINIPTMWGTDAVHGHNNVIGATLFPHNIALGAAHDAALVKAIAQATAEEVLATGIDWIFAPTVAVVRDDRWGRTYEGYSEDPELVREYSHAFVQGVQGAANQDFFSDHHVISTVKHFLGDGGTEKGDDQGDNLATEQELFDLHAQGYIGGLTAGAQTVMASFNSWHGKKNHGNKYLLTDILKTRMGFDGLVVGDWNGHGQVKGCTNENCSASFNAGVDIFMVPTDWKALYENTIAQVKSGEISEQRLNDAVRRILRVKMRAGLFDKPSPKHRALSGNKQLIGSAEHRAIARKAVRESLVLLKNNQQLLPINPTQNILVAGSGANNIGQQSGGWSITWQGTDNSNADFPGATSIYAGIKAAVDNAGGTITLAENGDFSQKPDVAIVVFGEQPYAEGNGDIDNLEFQRGDKTDLTLLQKLKAQNIPVVSVFLTGRPLWVNAELNASNAFVVAWLPGTEGEGVADVIIADNNGKPRYDFHGKLSFSWPATAEQSNINRFSTEQTPLLPYGFGLQYGEQDVLSNQLSVEKPKGANKLANLPLFHGVVARPWRFSLFDQTGETKINSSIANNNVINYRTSDRSIQEDARHIAWNGKGNAAIALTNNFPADLRRYQEVNTTLNFNIKILSPIPESANVSMQCGDHCLAAIPLHTVLNNSLNVWQSVSIPLQCFKNQGADFSKIFRPFELSSTESFTIEINDISLEIQDNTSASAKCDASVK